MTAIFKITNGTDEVDLIHGPVRIKSLGWKPAYPQYKGGGVRRSSPLADGQRLVSASYDTMIESVTVAIWGASQDANIATLQKLESLFVQAKDYWCAGTRNDLVPVWIEKKASNETNTSYAIVVTARFDGLNNWFEQPFLQADCEAVQDDVVIQIERGHWQGNVPGEATCVPISNSHFWPYSEWAVIDSTPALDVNVLFEGSDGTLYAGESTSGGMLRSVDGGLIWIAPSTAPTGIEMAMCEDDIGRVYVFTNVGVYRTVDSGDNWTQISVVVRAQYHNSICFCPLNKGMYAIDMGGEAFYSADYGVNWTQFGSLGAAGGASGRTVYYVNIGNPTYGALLIGHTGSHGGSCHIRYWTVFSATVVPTGENVVYDNADSAVVLFYEAGDGYVYAGTTGELLRCAISNLMLSWSQIASGFNGINYSICRSAVSGMYYLTGSARIYFSTNMLNWSYRTVGAATQFYALVYSSVTGAVYAGEAGDIWTQVETVEVGQLTPTCDGAYAVNRHGQSNVTHAYVDNGGVFTRVFPSAALPFELFPAVPVANDALYIGFDSNHPTVFGSQNFVFNIGVPNTGITVVWEYSNAAAGWTAVQGVEDSTFSFGVTGVNSVSLYPSAVYAQAVNGITAYWFRCRVTVVDANYTVPTQQTQEIYAVTWPFVEISSTEVQGDIPALAAIEILDRGDKDGPAVTTTPSRWANMLAVGLRSTSRGVDFTPYLPCSYDDQTVSGVDVQLGFDCAYVAEAFMSYLTTPYKYYVKYDPSETQPMLPRVSWVMPTGIAAQYQGSFHVFVRCMEEYSATYGPEIQMRVKVVSGTSGLEAVTQEVAVPYVGKGSGAAGSGRLVSLGRLTMPSSGLLSRTEQASPITISLEASSDGGNNYMYFYDIVLIPIDEWACFSTDMVFNLETALQAGKKLVMDSVYNPKATLRSILKSDDADGFVQSLWSMDTNGLVTLPTKTACRLWFMSGFNDIVAVADDSAVDNKAYFSNSGAFFLAYGIKAGHRIYNLTDGSQGIISQAETDKLYATLFGGTDNDFDNGDTCLVFTDSIDFCFESLYKIKLWKSQRYLSGRGAN